MASSWDRVGQAASVMQVTGVDAFGLVNMIVQAAHTARRNRDLCQQLAQHVLIVADLLRKLDIPALRQHLETRRPLELLDAALFRAYKLVRSCAQRQENTVSRTPRRPPEQNSGELTNSRERGHRELTRWILVPQQLP